MEEANPLDKAERIKVPASYQIIDTPAEQTYDDIVELASVICETPFALVSLVNDERFWFKSKFGIEIEEVPSSMSFCSHAIRNPKEIFLVNNALSDIRFADNPLVTGEPYIRFYAGAPLITGKGEVLGMLCVLDRQPRHLSAKQKISLRVLAKQVVAQLEMRQLITQMKEVEEQRRKVETALRESEARFKAFMKNSPAVAYMKNDDGTFVYVNRMLENVFEIEEDSLLGKTDFDLLSEQDAQAVTKNDALVLSEMKPKEVLEETIMPDGSTTYWLSLKFPFTDTNGKRFIGGVSFDITARKVAEEKLNESERRYRNLFELSPGYISIHDMSGILVSVNPAAATALGYEPEEIIGKNLADFLTPASRPSFEYYLRQLKNCSRHEGLMHVSTKDGNTRTWQYRNCLHREEKGEIYMLGYAQDITELKIIEKNLQNLTMTDELTNLYNRRGFFTISEQALRYARRTNKYCVVIYADLDNLKPVNDQFGHAAGSQMIIDAASVFKALFRESDVIARLGGDEYVIFVQDSSEDGVEIIRKRLRKQVKDFNLNNPRPIPLSISFGIVLFDPKNEKTIESLVSEADKLMYLQKYRKKTSMKTL